MVKRLDNGYSHEYIIFDKNNTPEPFEYIAEDLETRKLVIGNVVIKQPHYSPREAWKYYIVQNNYFVGHISLAEKERSRKLRPDFKLIEVDPLTVKPFDQIQEVRYNQTVGINTYLCHELDPEVGMFAVSPDGEIPLEKWGLGVRKMKFKDTPIGARFKYPGLETIWVKLNAYPEGLRYDGKGLICEWKGNVVGYQQFACFGDETGSINYDTEIELL